ncbi:conserved hypothetical protein [Mesorhizobium metallidurans STM 2683]|uniref:Uncharacterized protein n=1 Tax=Mesorhizobium metallidurans STM 2683 TaxID=1297569 RepID=M5ESE9_9HYPH|nr:conserved hypothetical protein [Mesorhizobium metallidurans STM 2683]
MGYRIQYFIPIQSSLPIEMPGKGFVMHVVAQNRYTLLGDMHYSAARPFGRAKDAVTL